MSTTEKPFEQLTADEQEAAINAAREAAAKPPDPPPAAEKPSFVAADGTRYEADTQDDLLKKVTEALNNTKNAMRDRERQIYELKQSVKPPAAPPVVQPPSETFSKDEYYRLMESDPLKAADYLRGHDPQSRAIMDFIEGQRKQQALQLENSRFNAETEYGKVETPEINQAMLARMQEKNREMTADNLKLSFLELKEEGKIPVLGKPAEKPPKANPPSAAGSGGSIPSSEIDIAEFARMSSADQLKYLASRGVDVTGIQ